MLRETESATLFNREISEWRRNKWNHEYGMRFRVVVDDHERVRFQERGIDVIRFNDGSGLFVVVVAPLTTKLDFNKRIDVVVLPKYIEWNKDIVTANFHLVSFSYAT